MFSWLTYVPIWIVFMFIFNDLWMICYPLSVNGSFKPTHLRGCRYERCIERTHTRAPISMWSINCCVSLNHVHEFVDQQGLFRLVCRLILFILFIFVSQSVRWIWRKKIDLDVNWTVSNCKHTWNTLFGARLTFTLL